MNVEASSKGSSGGRSYPLLPHQLVLDQILTKLPSKSLIRFSCVCKHWSTLILHDPHFASSHFLHYSQKNSCFLYKFGGEGEVTSFYLSSGEREFDGGFVDLHKMKTIGSGQKWELIGSCNGLICLFNITDQIIEVCNPARHQRLPIFPRRPITRSDIFGFGYDSLSEEYKVVIINLDHFECMVFSLGIRMSCWREVGIDKDAYSILSDDDGFQSATFCNGTLYWSQGVELVSFHLHQEKFQVIPFPIKRFYGFSSRLLVHKGSLCCVNLSAISRAVVVWCVELFVLQDEGSKQVWKKNTFVLPQIFPGHNIQLVDFHDQLILHRAMAHKQIKIFNLQKKKGKVVRKPDDLSNMDHWVVNNHVENLISLQRFGALGVY